MSSSTRAPRRSPSASLGFFSLARPTAFVTPALLVTLALVAAACSDRAATAPARVAVPGVVADLANPDDDEDGDGLLNGVDACPLDVTNDADGDGYCGDVDNCPADFNPDQADWEADGAGDVCDNDDDQDGVFDGDDNCFLMSNPGQADWDGDRVGDACDGDDDADGVPDYSDACPNTPAGTPVTAGGCLPYGFTGFFQPVDNGVYNKAKAGVSIPVRFSLGSDQGLGIFKPDYPKAEPVVCPSGAAVDPIEETVAATATTLTYSPATAQYTYVWKTSTSWAGTCRRFVLGLKDGTPIAALFQFTR